MENNNILSALKAIDVASLSRADWIAVGMALKEEGYPCSIWDDWSTTTAATTPVNAKRNGTAFTEAVLLSRAAPSSRWQRTEAGHSLEKTAA